MQYTTDARVQIKVPTAARVIFSQHVGILGSFFQELVSSKEKLLLFCMMMRNPSFLSNPYSSCSNLFFPLRQPRLELKNVREGGECLVLSLKLSFIINIVSPVLFFPQWSCDAVNASFFF